MAEVQIASISHRHEAIVDWLLTHPEERNLQALANHMNLSRSWLSIVMNSDVFKEYYERRRIEYNATLAGEIVDRQHRVTAKALTKLEQILDDDELDPRLVLDVANKTAERLGYGTKQGTKTTIKDERIQEVVRPVSAGALTAAREVMRRTITTERTLDVPEAT